MTGLIKLDSDELLLMFLALILFFFKIFHATK
jgi:hypothetical protein